MTDDEKRLLDEQKERNLMLRRLVSMANSVLQRIQYLKQNAAHMTMCKLNAAEKLMSEGGPIEAPVSSACKSFSPSKTKETKTLP